MKNFYENWLEPYIQNPELAILPILLLFIGHILGSRRNKRSTLLSARLSAYRMFISEYSVCFSGPSFVRINADMRELEANLSRMKTSIDGLNLSNIENSIDIPKEIKTEIDDIKKTFSESESKFFKSKTKILTHERANEVTRIFGECRLVAGELLERRLRDMYTKISDELHSGEVKKGDTEYYTLGLEIEQYMRYDLGSINYFDLFVWRLFFVWKRKFSARDTIESESER